MSYSSQYPPPYYYPLRPRNGFAVTSLVCGIVGLLLVAAPILGASLGMTAFVFGVCNLIRLSSRVSDATVRTWFGIVLGAAAFLLSIVVYALAIREITGT